jgi:hypothetical protein
VAIASILVNVLFGAGWWKSRREAEKLYKQGFLMRLQFVLEQNKRIFDYVTKKLNLEELEYAPNWVQAKLNELDEFEQQLVKAQIDTIKRNNLAAIDIITEHSGEVRSESLRQELEKFVAHAMRFNDIWIKITAKEPAVRGRPPNADLQGPKYPPDLDRLLQEEIDRY